MAEVAELDVCRKGILFGFRPLAIAAAVAEPVRPLYNMVPKFRMLDHLLRDCVRCRYNFGWCWAMTDEDFVGQIMKLTRGCHLRTISERGALRWLLNIFAAVRSDS